MKQVTAFQVGRIEKETAKAINLSGRWFPKSAVSDILDTAEGHKAIVLKAWFVARNQHLVKDELGVERTVQVELVDGSTLFQGKPWLVHEIDRRPEFDAEDADTMFDRLVSEGMNEREASRVVSRSFR